MNPNIYHFAHTEYAQDAFISWLCSCCNQNDNSSKKQIAEKFIKELLGVNIQFSTVKVQNQYLKIDVLLTLESEREKYYVIIEDKKFSKYHGRQLERYVRALIKEKRTSEDKIFAVYYKTGHISKTPNGIYFKNKKYFYDTTIPSEWDSVKVLQVHFPALCNLTICDLSRINAFFWREDIRSLIRNSGSEILEDYSNNIHELNKSLFETELLPARTEKAEHQEIWGKVFDDFIFENVDTFNNLSFKLDYYAGVYWEIYITKKVSPTKGEQEFPNQPILNVRSDMFRSKKEPRIHFFFVKGSPILGKNEEVEEYDFSSSYILKWNKMNSLCNADFSGEHVRIDDFKLFLNVICKEFSRSICDNSPFDLYKANGFSGSALPFG